MLNELEQLVKLLLTNRADKAVHAHNCRTMANTITVTNAYVGSFGNLVMKFAETLPAIKYDAVTKETSEVEVNEINISLRAFVGQLVEARPEVAELYSQVKLARDEKKPALMSAFIRLMTNGATYDIDPVRHSAGETFEDGTVARYDGYTYHIAAARFADAVEAKLQPKSVEDDLAMFGF